MFFHSRFIVQSGLCPVVDFTQSLVKTPGSCMMRWPIRYLPKHDFLPISQLLRPWRLIRIRPSPLSVPRLPTFRATFLSVKAHPVPSAGPLDELVHRLVDGALNSN